jgi:hypothetical protein
MQTLVLTLVFSVVMLIFMAFPAMKIAQFIQERTHFSKRTYDILQLLLTLFLSLLVGLFLRFG